MRNFIEKINMWKNYKWSYVSTGWLNRVVVKLQNAVISTVFGRSQYTSWFDRILKHVSDYFIPTYSTKPTFHYEFVNKVVKYCDNLHQFYKPEIEMEMVENPGWRDIENGNKISNNTISIQCLMEFLNHVYALILYFLIPKWEWHSKYHVLLSY